MKQIRRLHMHVDLDTLITELRASLLAVAADCIRERGAFHCVLAGGATPQKLYQVLRSANSDWQHWHIYFGDERCVAPDDAQRNDAMAYRAWLAHVPIPRAQIHSLCAQLGPAAGAAHAAAMLAGLGSFDLVLLGIGEDGHTASLFPYMQAHLLDDAVATAVDASPKPPPQRVSLSARRLSQADRVWFIVAGESKRAALTHWLSGAALPAAAIAPAAGVDIHTDLRGLIPL